MATPFFEILQNVPLTNSGNLGHDDALLESLMGHRCLLLDVPRMELCSSWDIKYIHSLLTRNKMKVCKNLSLNLFTSLLQGSNDVSLLSVTFYINHPANYDYIIFYHLQYSYFLEQKWHPIILKWK